MEKTFNFFEKETERQMYSEIKNDLIKLGYKPIKKRIKPTFKTDFRLLKKPNEPLTKTNKQKPYPYSITIKYNPKSLSVGLYKIAV